MVLEEEKRIGHKLVIKNHVQRYLFCAIMYTDESVTIKVKHPIKNIYYVENHHPHSILHLITIFRSDFFFSHGQICLSSFPYQIPSFDSMI